MNLSGIYPTVPVQFMDNGDVDYASIKGFADGMTRENVHSLAIMGTLGWQLRP